MNKIPENEIKHLKTLIPLRSKETVGYKEAENKESFKTRGLFGNNEGYSSQ